MWRILEGSYKPWSYGGMGLGTALKGSDHVSARILRRNGRPEQFALLMPSKKIQCDRRHGSPLYSPSALSRRRWRPATSAAWWWRSTAARRVWMDSAGPSITSASVPPARAPTEPRRRPVRSSSSTSSLRPPSSPAWTPDPSPSAAPVCCQSLTPPHPLRSRTFRSCPPILVLWLEFPSSDYIEVPAFTAAIEAHQRRITEAIMTHALQICAGKDVRSLCFYCPAWSCLLLRAVFLRISVNLIGKCCCKYEGECQDASGGGWSEGDDMWGGYQLARGSTCDGFPCFWAHQEVTLSLFFFPLQYGNECLFGTVKLADLKLLYYIIPFQLYKLWSLQKKRTKVKSLTFFSIKLQLKHDYCKKRKQINHIVNYCMTIKHRYQFWSNSREFLNDWKK